MNGPDSLLFSRLIEEELDHTPLQFHVTTVYIVGYYDSEFIVHSLWIQLLQGCKQVNSGNPKGYGKPSRRALGERRLMV